MNKYRAWDKEKKEMYEVTCIDFIKKMVCVLEKESDKICRWIPFRKVVLMQSTGLKDKNDVEIFEGDVVKLSRLPQGQNQAFVVQDFVYGKLIFESVTKIGKDSFGLDGGYRCSTLTIIGNIHANPELLEEVE